MILLITGAAICYAALAVVSLVVKTDDWWAVRPTPQAAIITLALLPLAATWAGAEIARHLRRPRILTPFAHPLAKVLRGVMIGGTACVLSVLAVVLFERPLGGQGWLPIALAGFVAPTLFLLTARPLRPGRCPRCDYSLDGTTPAASGRCPECGLDQIGAAWASTQRARRIAVWR